MFVLLTVLLISSVKGIPMLVYENARFVPFDVHFFLYNITDIPSQGICACQCYEDPMCLTAIYSGIIQQCSLYFARLEQGFMQVFIKNENTGVLNFPNKTLPGK